MAEPITTGLRLEGENRRLKRAIEEFSILNDLEGAISPSFDLLAIVQTIIRRPLRAVGYEVKKRCTRGRSSAER